MHKFYQNHVKLKYLLKLISIHFKSLTIVSLQKTCKYMNQLLKNQIFSNLKNQGFHEQIKKQLRLKIIQQLKDRNILQTKNEKKMLFRRVLSSLIMQQLQINDSPFTQSIYSIQSGFQGSHITRGQLIQMLTFRQNQIKQDESILQFILRRKQPFASTTLKNIEIQTNPDEIGYTLEQKLMMVDQQYRMNLAQKQKNKMNAVYDKKKFQQQVQQKMKKQIDLFKQFQTHKIKIKVGEQWRKKFQDYSNSLAEEYRKKYDQVRKKDKALNEEYILKNNQLNLKVNDSQKTIRQKMQVLDMKSITLQTQMQNISKSKKDFQDQTSKKQKQLNDKAREYDSLSLNINQKIKYEVNLAKLSIQQQYQQKQAESLRRKKVIDEDYGKIMSIKDSIDIVEKQNVRLSNENNMLRTHLTSLEVQLKNIVLEMGNKVQRIEVLKDDLIETKTKQKEVQQRIKQEIKKSKRYESQIIGMRQQLDKFRSKQNFNNNSSQISQPSQINLKNPEAKKLQQVNRKMEKLKHQRKKDIQKFKLEF